MRSAIFCPALTLVLLDVTVLAQTREAGRARLDGYAASPHPDPNARMFMTRT